MAVVEPVAGGPVPAMAPAAAPAVMFGAPTFQGIQAGQTAAGGQAAAFGQGQVPVQPAQLGPHDATKQIVVGAGGAGTGVGTAEPVDLFPDAEEFLG